MKSTTETKPKKQPKPKPDPATKLTVLTGIRNLLRARAIDPETGAQCTEFDIVCKAYVSKMKEGSFIHTKEILDREEGKVPTRIADADGGNIKLYASMPLEGSEAP